MAVYLGSNQVGETISIDSGGTGQEDRIIDRTISGSYENSRVTNIGSNAFQSCSSLTIVSFPVATTIKEYAFYKCTSLTTASFPSATSIGDYAFYRCSSLTTTSFPAVTYIGSNTFYTCRVLPTISFSVVTSIGRYAFQCCYKLLSLYLLGSSIPTLASTDVFISTPISSYTTSTGGVYGSIYVPASLYSSYKTATNWTVYSSRFVSV